MKDGQEIAVVRCPLADKEHAEDKRQYAHVFHRSGPVACVADAFFDLPRTHQAGLLLHEIGHLLAGESGTEAQADREARGLAGIMIRYRDTHHGDRLQWIGPSQAKRMLAAANPRCA